jgi:hypothetical protein
MRVFDSWLESFHANSTESPPEIVTRTVALYIAQGTREKSFNTNGPFWLRGQRFSYGFIARCSC